MRKLSMIYENPVDNFLYIYVEILAPYMNKYNITPNMITTETPKSAAFFKATLILFLCLDKPVSIHIKPACMMKTNIAQSMTHKVSILLVNISTTSWAISLLIILII